jgi:hypothetical protein
MRKVSTVFLPAEPAAAVLAAAPGRSRYAERAAPEPSAAAACAGVRSWPPSVM